MSLYQLALDNGWQLSILAVAVRCDPLTLERVDQRRQPLPLDVASGIATVLGLQLADVCHEVHAVTVHSGPDARRPVPLQLGDTFTLALYAPTLDMVPPVLPGD